MAGSFETAMPCDECGAAAGEPCKPSAALDCECPICARQSELMKRGDMFHAGGSRELGRMVCEGIGLVPPDLAAQVDLLRAELAPPKRKGRKRS